MSSKAYRCCAVPQCGNKSSKTPNKIFVYVPHKKTIREKWLKLARRDPKEIVPSTRLYFCEDHFDLPNDMENYMQYHLMGLVSQVRMRPGCMPTKFHCQSNRRKRTTNAAKRANVLKKQRKMLTEKCAQNVELRTVAMKQVEDGETSSGSSGTQVSGSTADTTQSPQTQEHNRLQEYANNSTDEYMPEINDEADYSDDNETDDDDSPIYDKSLCQSRHKRARKKTTINDYEEELYEFGRYVTEQLHCLDVEDARLARIKIVTALSKFVSKRVREPSTLLKKTKTVGTQTVSSESKDRVTTQPPKAQVSTKAQFAIVNTANPPKIKTETTVNQEGKILESSASDITHVKIEPIENLSDVMDTAPLSPCTMLNMNQVSSPRAPLRYITVPVTGPQFDNKQYGRSVRPLVPSSGSSMVTQSSSLVPARTLVTETGTSNMNISVVSVKTEPEFGVFEEAPPPESLLVKREPTSDDEA